MKVSRSILLPYSAEKMFDVVADIRSYPSFLKWCDDIEIISESTEEVIAKLIISYSKLNFSLTTKNKMQQNKSITMNLVDGPFSNFTGQWLIEALNEDACKVLLEMDFMFESKITHKLFGRIFESVINDQIEAFQKRAEQLYGSR